MAGAPGGIENAGPRLTDGRSLIQIVGRFGLAVFAVSHRNLVSRRDAEQSEDQVNDS